MQSQDRTDKNNGPICRDSHSLRTSYVCQSYRTYLHENSSLYFKLITAAALVTPSAKDGEEGKEDVDNIHVEGQGSIDMLLCGDLMFAATDNHLGIIHKVHGEQQSNEAPIDHFQSIVVEENAHEAKDQDNHGSNEQVNSAPSEIVLRLARKEHEEEADDSSGSGSHEHGGGSMQG